MALELLTATKIENIWKRVQTAKKRGLPIPAKDIGMHHDGGGLYLQVTPAGSVSWILRYQKPGRDPVTGKRYPARDMGLGAYHKAGVENDDDKLADNSLKKARREAVRWRGVLAAGKDPITEREKESKGGLTFRQQFERMKAVDSNFDPDHVWASSLDIYAMPVIGDRPITEITIDDIVGILSPVLNAGKRETARKLHQRIQAVLQAGLDSPDTPALKARLIRAGLRSFKDPVVNTPFASEDYDQLPKLMAELREHEEISAFALQFAMLTNVRRGAITGSASGRSDWNTKTNQPVKHKRKIRKPPMLWTDIDEKRRVWIIPALKTASNHNPQPFEVPLSSAAWDLLMRVKAMKLNDVYVFPMEYCGRYSEPMAHNAMQALMRKLRTQTTTHGTRTSFKTFAHEYKRVREQGLNDHLVIQTQMLHKVFAPDGKAEKAYMSKIKFMDARRALMELWGEYLTGSNVVPMKSAPGKKAAVRKAA